jgi:hypothetical protein
MIISHKKNIIFIKPKKVAGTSLEIALSRHCGSNDVITPISPEDERFRKQYANISAQNYQGFYNHISVQEVLRLIPQGMWNSYLKFSIVRNPFEVAVSKYFYRLGSHPKISFFDWMSKNVNQISNEDILALNGNRCLDLYLRYEELPENLTSSGLSFLKNDFIKVRAKGGIRPKSASVRSIFLGNKHLIKLIEDHCAFEIREFGYSYENAK